MRAPEPSVSVIVPVRDGGAALTRLLGRLDAQTLAPERFEVLVVDDGSESPLEPLVAAHRATSLRTGRPSGSYAARNAGIESAAADVLAFTDADCEPAPDWLERGLAELESSGADLLAGRIDVPLGERPSMAAVIDLARHLDQERHVAGGAAATANLFVRRAVFAAIGTFDARLVSGGDFEFVRRATAAGFRLAYSHAAVVSHPPRSRLRELSRKGYRIGLGLGELSSRSGSGRPRWASPGSYRPRRIRDAGARVAAAGHPVEGRRGVALNLAQYVFLQLPTLAGEAAATLRARRRSR